MPSTETHPNPRLAPIKHLDVDFLSNWGLSLDGSIVKRERHPALRPWTGGHRPPRAGHRGLLVAVILVVTVAIVAGTQLAALESVQPTASHSNPSGTAPARILALGGASPISAGHSGRNAGSGQYSVVATVGVGSVPEASAYDAVNGDVYVPNFNTNNVSVISGTTNSVVATVSVGAGPSAETVDGSSGDVYIANSMSNNVSVISGTTNTVVATIGVGSDPTNVTFDPGNGQVYVANDGGSTVTVLDASTNTFAATVTVQSEPWPIAVDPVSGDVYVGCEGSNNVSVLSGADNSVLLNVTVGSDPYAIFWSEANSSMYVANWYSDNISVISTVTNTVTATIGVGNHPTGFAATPLSQDLYVANTYSDNVSIINTTSNLLVGSIAAGVQPSIFSDAVSEELYVLNADSNSVSVVNVTSNLIVSTVPVGSTPIWAATDSNTRNVYVVNSGSNNVSVIDGGPAFAPIRISSFAATPASFVVGNATTLVVGATGGTGALSYAYSSMPSGCASSDAASLACTPTGTGNFHVAVNVTDTHGQYATASTWVNVTHVPVPEHVDVTFTETGLSSGANWNVMVNGSTVSALTQSITVQLVNGTYAYTVGAVTGFTATPSSGTVTVSGTAVVVSIQFTSVSAPPPHSNSTSTTGFLGLPSLYGYVVLGVVGLIIVIAAVLLLRRRPPPSAAPVEPGPP